MKRNFEWISVVFLFNLNARISLFFYLFFYESILINFQFSLHCYQFFNEMRIMKLSKKEINSFKRILFKNEINFLLI